METDWKKKYEEALNRFNTFKEKYCTETFQLGDVLYDKTGEMQKDFDAIFPELSESEDERIRKAVFKAFSKKDVRDVLLAEGVKVSEALSWLEKQKEQKPVKENKKETIIEELINYFKVELELIEDSENYQLIGDTKRWLSYLESQKEQKPVEKQDYSGLTDFERAIHRGFLVAGVENVSVNIIKETAQDCLAQQKSAWSEEDEAALITILHSLSQAINNVNDENERNSLLNAKSWIQHKLKFNIPSRIALPQSKQGWSEEDDEIFNITITHLLSYAYPNNPIYCKEAEKCVAWLKSFKNRGNSPKSNTNSPSWKPSDEQMDALLWCTAHLGGADHRVLAELYEHLKKL